MFTILILLFLGTAATTSKSVNKTNHIILETNNLPKAPSSEPNLALPAAATSKSGTGRISRTLGRNNLLIAHSAVLAKSRKCHLRASSGRALTHFFPFLYGVKNKSRHQDGRGVTTPTRRFKHHSKCHRNERFSRSLPVKEAEESDWVKIGRKIIKQIVLQALALNGRYTPGSNN